MLSKQDMVAYLEAGCKPKSDWKIGTEHEKFPFRLSDHSMIPYEGPDGIAALLKGMERYNWRPVKEGENTIALKKDKCNISLEPAGQFELSGAPLNDLHETCGEVHTHLAEVKAVCSELGLGMLGLGFNPTATRDDLFWMPKGRYKIMREYMPKVGSRGLDMMIRSCTVQVNLDFASEADMVKKLRVSMALQPIATALFANSPFKEGKPTGHLSYRNHVWQDVDNDRAGLLPFVFDEGFGFEAYVDHALKVPMYFVYRDGTYHDFSGQSFAAYNKGELHNVGPFEPTVKDWEDHLSTVFPEVRMKQFLEMRGADAGLWTNLCALPAFWVGLLYDQTALDAAYDLIKDWSFEEIRAMADDVPALALNAKLGDTPVLEIAKRALAISNVGLKNRGILSSTDRDETQYLEPLKELLDQGKCNAELLLEAYHGPWGGDIDRVFMDAAF